VQELEFATTRGKTSLDPFRAERAMRDAPQPQDQDAAIASNVRRFVLSGVVMTTGGVAAAVATGWFLYHATSSPIAPMPLFAALLIGSALSRILFHRVFDADATREAPSAELWQATLQRVKNSAPKSDAATAGHQARTRRWSAFWPVLWFCLAVYSFTAGSAGGMTELILVPLVLAFHEAGHLSAMRAFGYQDTRILFIPYLGAVTTGQRPDASTAEQVIVLAAGPVPGLVLGAALLLSPFHHEPLVARLALLLIELNLFNLLPLGMLDGGKLLSLLLFRRSPRLDVCFAVFSSALLALIAAALHAWLLFTACLLTAVSAPFSYRIRSSAHALHARMRFPERLDDASDEFLRQLFEEAYFKVLSVDDIRRGLPDGLAARCALIMAEIHARGAAHPAVHS